MSTLFWKVFGMPLPWTVDALTALFPHDTMQDRLRKMFEADLAEAGETLQDYELGANLMPVFSCWKCGKRTESRYFTWGSGHRTLPNSRRHAECARRYSSLRADAATVRVAHTRFR